MQSALIFERIYFFLYIFPAIGEYTNDPLKPESII